VPPPGSAFSVTEFVNALDVLENHPRYPKRHAFEPHHRPLSLQLLGDEAEQILAAALQLVPQVKPDMIDINLGCQSKNVTQRGAGAALLKTPEKIAAIFRLMTANFDQPITGKIRLGWDEDQLNYLEVAQASRTTVGRWSPSTGAPASRLTAARPVGNPSVRSKAPCTSRSSGTATSAPWRISTASKPSPAATRS
jgi:hypothetical protein